MAKSIDKLATKSPSQSFYGKWVPQSIYFELTNDEEITDIINQLNPNKASGYDDCHHIAHEKLSFYIDTPRIQQNIWINNQAKTPKFLE